MLKDAPHDLNNYNSSLISMNKPAGTFDTIYRLMNARACTMFVFFTFLYVQIKISAAVHVLYTE
jgi:hypothetical protein